MSETLPPPYGDNSSQMPLMSIPSNTPKRKHIVRPDIQGKGMLEIVMVDIENLKLDQPTMLVNPADMELKHVGRELGPSMQAQCDNMIWTIKLTPFWKWGFPLHNGRLNSGLKDRFTNKSGRVKCGAMLLMQEHF